MSFSDESYVKTITQAHKQLLDPAIQTDERTLLLSKIINTCLEARGRVDSESDLESKQTDAETEIDTKDRDSEVMAPPKSLPKKTKKLMAKDKKINEVKPKEKTTSQKRNMEDDNGGSKAKKVKTTENDNGVKKLVKNAEKTTDDAKKKDKKSDGNNEEVKKNSNEKLVTSKNVKNNDKHNQINKKSNQKQHTEVLPKIRADSSNENNKNTANIAKKRKNNENDPELTKNTKNDGKKLKKTKSNEELKRNNIQTGESEPKKIKSSTDLIKSYKQIFDTKADSETNTLKNETRDEKKTKVKKSNVVENKPSESTEVTKTAKDKPKNNEEPTKKIDRKVKMSMANDKKFDQITKKLSGNIENKDLNSVAKTTENKATKTVTNLKNTKVNRKPETDQGNSNNIEKKTADVPKSAESTNNKPTKLTETVDNKKSGNTKDFKTVKIVTEKNANIKSKEKNINVQKVVTEKVVKNKTTNIFNKPEKAVISTSTPKNYKKLPKITTKTVRNIIHKSPKPKASIKVQDSRKSIKTKISEVNTQVFSGITEKENGGKISKIPQKKMSFNSEKILKSNILRISPSK